MLILNNGPLTVDADQRRAWLDEEELPLGRIAFDFLAYMLASPRGKAHSRDELLTNVWKVKNPDLLDTRLIDAMVYRLNKKVGNGWFRAVPGYGYAFESPVDEETQIIMTEQYLSA